MIAIRRAVAGEWRDARAIRLRALADAPGAFATTLAREEAVPDDGWVERVTTAAWFLAWHGDRVVGVAVGIGDPDEVDARHLVGMWVEPAHRGDGTAGRLVDAVVGWARDDGAAALALWVVDGNDRARRFYDRLGFHPTGQRGPLPSDPTVLESRMRRTLTPDGS
ncbi:GNAT family N-acetyltransferase [Actinomycetospora sp. NBRC 106378]|uniref:GNAT family N-acetyltransferase n=1 Tax=Actinomycetospora sp. NBRC 106378 TaxID=3032208 RepID=UPI0024A37E70|nr:GNAT family N-acetyltransferase [Actinomycetospora sp. NBRC 106378]GLZ50394.1 GNAT family N-acetyltransferase [Actinomycetospora sp. NBRC 106378]